VCHEKLIVAQPVKTFPFLRNPKVCYHIHKSLPPVTLYGCETWSLTLREGCRLRMFQNMELRRIPGPKIEGVKVEWRR